MTLGNMVKLTRGFISVQTHFPERTDITKELVEAWYRARAQVKFRERLVSNLERFARPGEFMPSGLTIKFMSQRSSVLPWILSDGELRPGANKIGSYPAPEFVWATTNDLWVR
jgi:hypothetical protein